MKRVVNACILTLSLLIAFLVMAGQGISATIANTDCKGASCRSAGIGGHGFMTVGAYMRFDKMLGIMNGSDISYGRIRANRHDRITITPSGEISSENGTAVGANSNSHPGEVKIHDGRSQQFHLHADGYNAGGLVRPINALCSFGETRNVPCSKISSIKGKEVKTVYLGMVIQVLGDAQSPGHDDKPSFDLSVVYL